MVRYDHNIRRRYNRYRHTDTCIFSVCFISRGTFFSRSVPHGRADCLAPLSTPCASLTALLKRTATITEKGVGCQTPRSGTVAFNFHVAPLKSRIFASVKAITVKFLVWENTTCKELRPLQLTSKVTPEFAYNGTSKGLHKERYCRIDVISELKCMWKMPSGPNKM